MRLINRGKSLAGSAQREPITRSAPFLFHIYFLTGVKIPAEVLMRF